jgi:hypothetical protein
MQCRLEIGGALGFSAEVPDETDVKQIDEAEGDERNKESSTVRHLGQNYTLLRGM